MFKRLLSLLLLNVLFCFSIPLPNALAMSSEGATINEYEMDMLDSITLLTGTPFKLPDDAAKCFAQEYFPVTDYVQFEIATIIYSYNHEEQGRVYSYLKPIVGDTSSVQPLHLQSYLPEGSNIIAVAHTHPQGNGSFSGSDTKFAHTNDVSVYLIGTQEVLKVYEKTVVKDKTGHEKVVWCERIVTEEMSFRELSEWEMTALYYGFKPKWDALAESLHAPDRILYKWSTWPNVQKSISDIIDFIIDDLIIDETVMLFFNHYLLEMLVIDIYHQ